MTFEKVWSNHQDALSNFIKTKVQDIAIAEDILQEVGIKLHQAIQKKIDIRNYQTWLFQVTRNTIADYYRQKKVSTTLLRQDNSQLYQHQETNGCPCDIAGFVIQHYLPDAYSVALYLSDIEQIPQQQVATILDLSLSATKSRIQRGRKKLKEMAFECFDIQTNKKGQITDFHIKTNCELPKELLDEMEKVNFSL